MKQVTRTRVNAVECPRCHDLIYSRARHDFHYCSCKDTFIDGGFDYIRVGGKDIDKIKNVKKFISCSKQELYNDWNERKDHYGWIKPSRTEDELRRLQDNKRVRVN